ncbi:MAG: phage tail assembly chaperone [Marivita sp.]
MDEAAAQAFRHNRDHLLAASDWTQVADAPVDAAAWAAYRQALRDVPAQAGFPDNITWPEAPA